MRFIVKDFRSVPVDTSPTLSFDRCDAPDAVHRYYQSEIASDPAYEPDKEHVIVVTVNSRIQPTGWNLVSIGGLSEATCHPREVFRPVIVRAAHGFILIHNHPSGDPSPSHADHKITRRIKEAAELLQIRMLDHLIIGSPSPGRLSYYSFKEAGLL